MTPCIRLHANDDVLIARAQLVAGTHIDELVVRGLVPPGHKIACHALRQGAPVRRYNQIIGFASRDIAAGEHVHTHNLDMGPDKGDFERDYAFGADLKPAAAAREAVFMGIPRPDGRVATRNYIGVLSSVNCSATVAHAIADHFSRRTNPEALAHYPNIDGVVALTHGTGCGMASEGLGMHDATQAVAKAYRAACTPDFYVFDRERKLVYRGQMDPSRPQSGVPVTGADLRAALDAVLADQPLLVAQDIADWNRGQS